MSINSMLFLTAFLPAVFVADRLCVRNIKCKNVLLLLASLLFYAWGEPVYILLLLASIALNYGFGLLIEWQRERVRAAQALLAAGIVANLALLGYYKYFDFFLRILNRLSGRELFEMQDIPLPVGISFFTFGAISYLADLHRGKYSAERNAVNMALYMAFFPKISVGPIARYADFGGQLKSRRESAARTAAGIRRFSYGLGKKVLIANVLGGFVDQVYAQDIGNVTGVMAWCAALLYTLQIYYDFSGFSDMAVGLGKMFGFDICENFDYPYLSGSIQEFWRRWHISLGSWFRDYLYIPLGGNRRGKVRTYANLVVVWFATGLWHGATTAFIVWGMLHGFFIILERAGLKKLLDKSGFFKYIYTDLIVVFGWVFFRLGNLRPAIAYIGRMLMPWRYTASTYAMRELMSNRCMVMAATGVLGMGLFQTFLKKFYPRAGRLRGSVWELAYCMLLVAVSMLFMINGTYNPAIYLNF